MKLSKTHFITCLLLLATGSFVAFGQATGFTSVKNVAELKKQMQQKHQSIQTIKSQFTQEKHLSFMKDKVVSKGTLMLKQGKKVRIEYTSPFAYLIVINADKLYIKDGKKVTKVNIGADKTFSKLNEVLLRSIQGNFEDSKEFSVNYLENKEYYLLELTPINASPDNLFKKISVYFDHTSLQVDMLDMLEKSGDLTKMKFENPELNTSIPDEVFVVR